MIPSTPTAWTPRNAALFWRYWRNRQTDEVIDDLMAAEAYLLERPPTTAAEAEIILQILIDQGGDGRCDGRDLKALRNLAAFSKAHAASTRPPRGRARAVA